LAKIGYWRVFADDVSMTSWRARGTDDDVDAESYARVAGHGGKMWGPQDDVEGHGAR